MYHCASIPSAIPQLAFKSSDSAHDELFLLQSLSSNGTLDTKHSKPLFGDSCTISTLITTAMSLKSTQMFEFEFICQNPIFLILRDLFSPVLKIQQISIFPQHSIPDCNVQGQIHYLVEALLHFQMPLGFPTWKIMPFFLSFSALRTPSEHNKHLGEKKEVFSPFLLLQPTVLEQLQLSNNPWDISAKISHQQFLNRISNFNLSSGREMHLSCLCQSVVN